MTNTSMNGGSEQGSLLNQAFIIWVIAKLSIVHFVDNGWIGVRKMNTRKFSNAQETKVAKAVGGRKTVNSGATSFQKGDVINSNFVIECKTMTTDRKSFTVQEKWLLENEETAFAMGNGNSALVFDFGPSANKRYYIISERLFQLLNYYMQEENNNG